MGINDAQFNRIIDVSFLGSARRYSGSELLLQNFQKSIVCPRHGRKPDIEINGTFTTREYLPVFNLTIKNLYLDLQREPYARIKVRCGYAGNTIDIEGSILTMYQESPGPEGRTVIQCQQGNMKDWLESTVQLNYLPGTPIIQVLEALKSKLNASKLRTGTKASTLVLKEPFMHDGSARDAMAKLDRMFEDDKLATFMRGETLCAICLATSDRVAEERLDYLSAPPQANAGSTAGTFYTTVTAPWMPKLQIGDILEIPSRVYIRNFGLVGTGRTQKIQVTAISFNFGTTGGTNRMTVQGFMVR
jgi:hypothetical protein